MNTVVKIKEFDKTNFWGIDRLRDLDNSAIQAIIDMEQAGEFVLSQEYKEYFINRLKK